MKDFKFIANLIFDHQILQNSIERNHFVQEVNSPL